jgi:uncharacterized caspase-like protein
MMVGERESYRSRRGAAKAPFDISQRVPDIIRYTSSYGAETSLESSAIGMGYFSHYLSKALGDPEADADGDGQYTGDNLVDYMTPRMIEDTDGHHRPRMSENGMNIVLASTKPAPPRPPRDGGRVLGLMVGLNYDGDPAESVSEITLYSTNGVSAVRDAFIRTGGAEAGDIRVLTDSDRPTREVILRALRKLADSAGPDDRIFFFFTGLGDRNGEYGCIVPHGYYGWEDGVGYAADIKPILESSAAASKWIFIDAGFSGHKGRGTGAGLAGTDMMVGGRDAYRARRGAARAPFDIGQRVPELIRYTSDSGAEGYSLESPELEMGYFSYYLAQALTDQETDADGDGLYTGDEIVDYVTPRILEATDDLQRPQMSKNGMNIVLAGTNQTQPPKPGEQDEPDGPSEDPEESGDTDGRVYALLVGINYKGSSSVSNLEGAENDVNAIRKVLLAGGVCGEDDITVLFDRDEPVRGTILSELEALAGRAGPSDRILFYYSGHGTYKGEYGGIVPYEYEAWEDCVKYTADIKPILESSAAAAKWMIIDACCSGMKGVRGRPDTLLAAMAKTDMMVGPREEYKAGSRRGRKAAVKDSIPNLIRFTGAYASESTWESDVSDPDNSGQPIRRGIFTLFLCEALSGAADADADGLLTGGEVLDYVQPRVRRRVREIPGAPIQLPRLSENGRAAFFIPAGDAGPQSAQTAAANRDDGNMPELFRAALAGDYATTERLLNSGSASVDDADATGWTALHFASTAAVAGILMENGADPNRQSNLGFTPLHTAAMLGRLEVVVALLNGGPDQEEQRADAGIVDKWGKTAQHRAMEKGNLDIADAIEPPE